MSFFVNLVSLVFHEGHKIFFSVNLVAPDEMFLPGTVTTVVPAELFKTRTLSHVVIEG